MSHKGIQELKKQGELRDHLEDDLEFCEYCTLGKSHEVKFHTGQHLTRSKLDYIHMDLWGPTKTPSHAGAVYLDHNG